MKMKKLRKLMKNPPYKHTCACLDEPRYLAELPRFRESCFDCRYWRRDDGVEGGWVDVTDEVPENPNAVPSD